MIKLLILLLLISCRAEFYTEPDAGKVPNNKNGNKPDNDTPCPSTSKTSNEYYNLNFVKPQSAEHAQVILEYFQRFNAKLKTYHPSHCSLLDDILSFADDTSDACDIDDLQKGIRQPGCALYSTIEIVDISADDSVTTAGHASRYVLWEQLPDNTKIYRYWTNIVLDSDHFLKNHQANMIVAWVIFLHEVGHGFDFKHNTSDKSDIMHPSSTEGINYDYDSYFKRIYEIVTAINFE